MKRPVVLALTGVLLAIVMVGGGAYAYYFSGLRTAPKPLALSSSAQSSPSAGPTAQLGGAWSIASGSTAGYRVKEVFAGQSSPHEAVARTSGVSGGLTLKEGSGGLEASQLSVAVDLSSLHSVDQVAGFDVARRDSIVNRSLNVSQFPKATFVASSPISVPSNVASGAEIALNLPGQITIHGVTQPATAPVKVRLNGGQVEVVGSISTNMTQFGVPPPQVSITVVQPDLTIEFQLVLTRQG